MALKSRTMALSEAERSWLPWFGKTGKLKSRWSYMLNLHRVDALEQVFDGIARTRVKILNDWAKLQWQHLSTLAELLADDFQHCDRELLAKRMALAADFSELFVINAAGRILGSTSEFHHHGEVAAKVMDYLKTHKAPLLHGPYVDELTARIGPSSSTFHDGVTLMFYQPVLRNGELVGAVCGRVPNDVVGDLIQREAGHVFHESGDNYLFMVRAEFDSGLQPGTALSRSRFEDQTFSLGDNLKAGIRTRWGTIKVRNHTELELVFNDPATGKLHPGVRETIRRGENLFVTYPGYSDYRHIPVVGKGVTFQMPGSPDRWGMMCEADLEEVYRNRSVAYQLMSLYLMIVAASWALATTLTETMNLSSLASTAISFATMLAGAFMFYRFGCLRLTRDMRSMVRMVRTIAEGDGNLSQRLKRSDHRRDETTMMSQWINNFIDNLEHIIYQVITMSHEIGATNQEMLTQSQATGLATSNVFAAMQEIEHSLASQLHEINVASETAAEMRRVMQQLVEHEAEQLATLRLQTDYIRQSNSQATMSIVELQQSVKRISDGVLLIKEVANQTNLLALNAAIESARAGEEGRGFAVVADEVGRLADRTKLATVEIGGMIDAVKVQAEKAVGTMGAGLTQMEEGLRLTEINAGEQNRVQENVNRMFAIIGRIESVSHEHSNKVRDIATITGSMQRALMESERSSRESDVAVSKLTQLVSQFRISTRGTKSA